MTLSVTPQELATNGTVTISGLAYAQPGVHISMSVTPPSGGATVVDLTANASGRYTSTFVKHWPKVSTK